MIIDIVVTTRNRLSLLRQTLECIWSCTKTPFYLHVIDDASEEENARYLWAEWQHGRIDHLLIRGVRCGIMSNSNAGAWMTFSDPVVFTDDDVLCPNVEPDWLACGLAAMEAQSDLGLLALNHPGARRNSYEQRGPVTLCKYVGGTFMFIRRKFLEQYHLPHYEGNFGHATTQFRSQQARANGWLVGYLTETFCYHTGHVSANGNEYKGHSVEPLDWETLRPPEKWIWRPTT